MPEQKTYDKVFLAIVIILSVVGIFVFTSASLGLLRDGDGSFSRMVLKQIGLGLVLGWLSLSLLSKINYKVWEKYSFWIFLLSIVATLLVFVPGLGVTLNGAKRWILLGPLSFQPAEFLKLGFVVFFAFWLSRIKDSAQNFVSGFLPSLLIISIPVAVLLAQPNTGTSLSIIAAGLCMFFAAGLRWKHLAIFFVLVLLMVSAMAYFKPYARERILTFVDPARDPQGAGYQVRQSLISIGSGRILGRGFGQGIQKYNYLPEPTGDAIFAVAGEEFGFFGATLIVLMFLAFLIRGLGIAERSRDLFGRLLTVGIVILMTAQSFVNMGAMLGILPVTGVPLLFLSQGGTALFFALSEIGIVLNISRYTTK